MSGSKISPFLNRPGEPAPPGRLLRPEVIGPPDCPIMHRWTLYDGGERGVKLLVHHFLPNADDRGIHDHPRPFWTLVLRGGYLDMAPCECAAMAGWRVVERGEYSNRMEPCIECGGKREVLNERMSAGMLRYRPATHRHRAKVSARGCWTLVLMGPLRRRWGFWREGRWWPWREYENTFGFGMRCGDDTLDVDTGSAPARRPQASRQPGGSPTKPQGSLVLKAAKGS